ncbi:2-oxoacid dehydrogenases acyltransferase-domain-containing protein [Polychytrium aggregatum]|uniref:2-oxoacid dehydrogenases acyltransferase-domain-containing protein n=1 Tax=Polychytrium aggregatum TaxID=110093 RepID=UPI0022FE093E|nr:2-oxoacid dehydrogenases acyltransferase-domain-containing protein [Polychytrium aggregatum]KAI9209080.1 2-oxoacid dehydrogenases acyltransferase-domain-containing protein [Polychytrium aggregatum]
MNRLASANRHLLRPLSSAVAVRRTLGTSWGCVARGFHSNSLLLKNVPYLLADVGEGITECEVIQWFVKEGERVEQFTRIAEVQSDKAAVEITSRFDGVVKKLHYKVGQMAKVGAPLVDIDTDEADDAAAEPTPSTPAPAAAAAPVAATPAAKGAAQPAAAAAEAETDDSQVFATPAVRRVAKENNVDLRKVVGTGKAGRIMKEDVIAFLEGGATQSAPVVGAVAPTHTPVAQDALKSLTPIQKAMFKQMTKSLSIPHFGYSDEVVLNRVSAFRETINKSLSKSPKHNLKKISYMPIFIKALSMALNEYPILNAMVVNGDDLSKVQLQYRGAHNIGIAMDTPQGLVVPNIKNCQSKSILEIAAELERLKELGKKNAITPADFANGTISLSNIGTIGGTVLHPVIVSSEVCIGAIGKTTRTPRFETVKSAKTGEEEEIIVAHEIMNVSWNADHRVVDGATMARFVQLWKKYLEDPALMAVELK